jgi:membrane protease YdiL (CAAX protease family)
MMTEPAKPNLWRLRSRAPDGAEGPSSPGNAAKSARSAAAVSDAHTWVGPALLGLVCAQFFAIVGVLVYTGFNGTEDRIGDGVGAGMGEVARRVGTETPLELTKWSIETLSLLQIPQWIGLALVPVAIARSRDRSLTDMLGLRFRPVDVPAGLALGVALQFVITAGYWVGFQLIGERDVSGPARELVARASGVGVVVLVLLTVIGAPLVEEAFYRGFLQQSMVARFSPLVGLVAASAIFAAVHFQVLQFPALFFFGLVVGGLAMWRGDLGMSIWTHIGFNGFTVISLLLAA